MTQIQDRNIIFRCPKRLKEKLATYANQNELHLSGAVRMACTEFINKEKPELLPEMGMLGLRQIEKFEK